MSSSLTVLVTGVNGFVGQHVGRQLQAAGHRVIGVSNQPELAPEMKPFVKAYYGVDLTNPAAVAQLELKSIDAIINLAGFASVGASANQQAVYDRVNIGVHSTLYQACLDQKATPRIIAVSSGAVYDPTQPLPLSETADLAEPTRSNEYIVSKQRMEAALETFRQRELPIIIARPFNHSGPGQLAGFLVPDLAQQIKANPAGQPLRVGNLESRRDYSDVRDVARAYILLATADPTLLRHHTYNICCGQSFSGQQVLDLLKQALGRPELTTVTDPARLRQNEIMDIYGSSARLQRDTGWQPTISLPQTISDYVTWFKQQVSDI